MKELVILLSQFKFQIDKQKQLLESFREIDQDGDGFISKQELSKYLTSMGEPLEDMEMQYLIDLATDKESSTPDSISIERLS